MTMLIDFRITLMVLLVALVMAIIGTVLDSWDDDDE
jgi:hypothetical protein